MKRFVGAAAITLAFVGLALYPFFFPPEVKDRPASRTGGDTAFGGKVKFLLSQPFHSGLENLSGFSLAVSNPGGRQFELRVRDSAGTVVASTRTGARISGVDEIGFSPVNGSAGKDFILELEALDAGPPLAFMGGRDGGALTANGTPTGHSLFFVPLGAVGPKERAATLLDRIAARKPFGPAAFAVLNVLLVGAVFGAAYFAIPRRVK